MRSIEIDNIRQFTTSLFAAETFDHFLTAEASFSTSVTISIDGHLNPEFIGEEIQSPENREGIVFWKKIRPICYEIIKGNKVPSQFRIVFKMPLSITRKFLEKSGLSITDDQIAGLFINVHFKQGKLFCVTGSSMKTFSLDKSLEMQWDEYVGHYLKQFC